MNGFEILGCPLNDTTLALEVLFASLPDGERRATIALLGESFDRDPLSRRGLLIARDDRGICGAVLVQEYPGRTAALWPPHALRGGAALEIRLAEAADSLVARREIVMAQALLLTHDDPAACALAHVGFVHLTKLEYMVAETRSARSKPRSGALRFEPYEAQEQARLAELVEATYIGADDCPELNGVRDVHDVLIGYQSTGAFDPANWFIVSHSGRDVGVLLLTEHAAARQWEIVYMALVPHARKRGFGTQMVQFALDKAAAASMDAVLLAVDARNEQGLRLYRKCGFRPWDQRTVYWKRYAREILRDSTQ